MTTSEWLLLLCTRSIFGVKAVELAGIVVDTTYRGARLASTLLHGYITSKKPGYMTAYTRNPRVVSLLHSHGGAYPLARDDDMRAIAQAMPFAETIDGVTYHINRYGDSGLYGMNDPADTPLQNDTLPLKERFPELQHPGTALVVAMNASNPYETMKGGDR